MHVLLNLFIMPPPHSVEALSVDGRRPSVCPVPDPKLRLEGHNKLKIWQEVSPRHGCITDTILGSKDQRSRSPGRLTPWLKKSAISSERKGLRTSNLLCGWMNRITVEVVASRRRFDACSPTTRQRKVAQAPKLTVEGCPCHGWHCTPVPRSKGQRSRSPDG